MSNGFKDLISKFNNKNKDAESVPVQHRRSIPEPPSQATPIIMVESPIKESSDSGEKSMSIAERIAAMKKSSQNKEGNSKPQIPIAKVDQTSLVHPVAALDNSETKEKTNEPRRPSISERIATAKANFAKEQSSPNTNQTNPTPKEEIEQNTFVEKKEEIKIVNETPDQLLKLKEENKDKETTTILNSEEPKKSGSIADKIAALKATKPQNSFSSTPPPPPKKLDIFPGVQSPPESAENYSESGNSNSINETNITPSKRMSIKDRMAALSMASPTQVSSPPVNVPPQGKRLSVDKMSFASNIPIPGLGGPRPIFPRPSVSHTSEESTSGISKFHNNSHSQDGELTHACLTRAAVPSMKRKKAVESVKLSSDWTSQLESEELIRSPMP